jgi:hypothetical protein
MPRRLLCVCLIVKLAETPTEGSFGGAGLPAEILDRGNYVRPIYGVRPDQRAAGGFGRVSERAGSHHEQLDEVDIAEYVTDI